MKGIEEMSLAELKTHAKEKGINFEANVKKEELKNMILQSEVKLTLPELIEKENQLKLEIDSKKQRIATIESENLSLNEKINSCKKDISLNADEIIATIDRLQKIENENNRQIGVHLEKISELNNKLKDISASVIKETIAQANDLKDRYKKANNQLNEFHRDILNHIIEFVKTHESNQEELNRVNAEIIKFQETTGVALNVENIQDEKLTIAEKSQIIYRLKDLSKIHSRMILR